MKAIGVMFSLIAALLFYSATVSTVPTDGAYALGYNLGIHAAWICCGVIAYWLLRKK